MTKKKNLTRSHKNRILGGVLGGVAEYFGWNVTITRLIYVLITLAAFPGIIFYILAWIIIPDDPRQSTSYYGDGRRKDITPDDS